jgi:hypothetical protein
MVPGRRTVPLSGDLTELRAPQAGVGCTCPAALRAPSDLPCHAVWPPQHQIFADMLEFVAVVRRGVSYGGT